jgi:hypothetical protein
MDRRPCWDFAQGQGVSWLDRSKLRRHNGGPRNQSLGGNYIAFVAILIVNQGNTGVSVGVVFYRLHTASDILFIPLKVDLAQKSLVAPTLVPDGHLAA